MIGPGCNPRKAPLSGKDSRHRHSRSRLSLPLEALPTVNFPCQEVKTVRVPMGEKGTIMLHADGADIDVEEKDRETTNPYTV